MQREPARKAWASRFLPLETDLLPNHLQDGEGRTPASDVTPYSFVESQEAVDCTVLWYYRESGMLLIR